MALKSGGTVNHTTPVFMDANQAMMWLRTVHHWACTKVTHDGIQGVHMTVTHAGHRVTSERRGFAEAANACNAKLKAADTPKLKLAR